MSKQYSVTQWVKNNKADNAEVEQVLADGLAKGRLWNRKDAREQLAMRRFRLAIASAGKH